jgi:hypothetical protein
MSFFRHREIFQSDVMRVVRERFTRRSRPHRLDEFPAGYSSAVCSPAWPASASPSVDHSALQSSCRSILFHRAAHSVLSVCLNSGDHSIASCLLYLRRARSRRFRLCALVSRRVEAKHASSWFEKVSICALNCRKLTLPARRSATSFCTRSQVSDICPPSMLVVVR